MTATALTLGACGGGSTMSTPNPTPTPTPACIAAFDDTSQPFVLSRAGSLGMRWPSGQPERIVAGSLAVRFEGSRISPAAAARLERLGARQATEMNPQGAATFLIAPDIDPRQAAVALRGIPGVAAAGPVVLRQLLAGPTPMPTVIPNDTDFTQVQQWDMYYIQMPGAWDVSGESSSVELAIIDTGYDLSNPDLVGKVDASIVYDLGNGKQNTASTVEDRDGHGTDVSGIAAADTNNKINVAGVAWNAAPVWNNVRLLEARVFPYGKNCGASTQDIAAAIYWAVKTPNNAKVLNLSLGSGMPDPVYEEPAVAYAISKGVVVVAAAGNDGANTIDYPAADPGVIAVGASAICGDTKNIYGSGHECVAGYSNFGSRLTLVAPGGDPNATQKSCTTASCLDYLQWILNLDSTQGPFTEQVGLFAGTSQATPHVAGAVALMLSKDPTLTPALALSTLKSSADNIGDAHQGAGRLNVLNALNQTP